MKEVLSIFVLCILLITGCVQAQPVCGAYRKRLAGDQSGGVCLS